MAQMGVTTAEVWTVDKTKIMTMIVSMDKTVGVDMISSVKLKSQKKLSQLVVKLHKTLDSCSGSQDTGVFCNTLPCNMVEIQ